jgi:DNA-directed RNA polymerase specialized sigma24 family protein
MGHVSDEVLDALEQLVEAVRTTTQVNEDILRRAGQIQAQRAEGRSWREVVASADEPLIVELVRRNLDALFDAGGRLRRAEAKALHDEGMTMEEIAKTFGVSRQRVSALLKERPAGRLDC